MKRVWNFIFTVIILGLLVYVLKDLDFKLVGSLLKDLRPEYFLFSVACTAGTFFIWAWRWKNTMSGIVDMSYWFSLKVLMAGVFMNTITPGTGIGGEFVRSYYVKEKYGVSKSKVFAGILADKFFNYVIFIFLSLLAIGFLFLYVKIPYELKIILEIIVAGFILIAIFSLFLFWQKHRIDFNKYLKKLYLFKIVRKNFKTIDLFEKYLERKKRNFTKVFQSVISDKRKLYWGIGLSLFFWILTFLASWSLFIALYANVYFILISIVIVLSLLLGDLSPLPGGVGLVESSMILLYSATGIFASLAALITLLSRFIYYVFTLGIGGIFYLYLREEFKK